MALASQALKYNYVVIQPLEGKAVDLTGHLQYIEYFENIMSPTISMNMKISSTFNFVSNLPIRGGEMIAMEVETLSGTFKFGNFVKDQGIVPGSGELYVYKLENMDQPSQAQSFTLKMSRGLQGYGACMVYSLRICLDQSTIKVMVLQFVKGLSMKKV